MQRNHIILCTHCRYRFSIWISSTGTLGDISCRQPLLGNSIPIPLSTHEIGQKAQVHPHLNCPYGSNTACDTFSPTSQRRLCYHRQAHYILCWQESRVYLLCADPSSKHTASSSNISIHHYTLDNHEGKILIG